MDPTIQSQPLSPIAPVQEIHPQVQMAPTAPPIIEGPPPKKKVPTLLALVILIVIIVLLGGGTYILNMKKSPSVKPLVTPSKPSPTKMEDASQIPKDWKTYNNDSIGFSFQYPSTWQRHGTALEIPNPDCKPPHQCGGTPSSVEISVDQNTDHLSLKGYIYQDEFTKAMDYDNNEKAASISANYNMPNYEKNSFNKDTATESLINTKIPGEAGTTRAYYMQGDRIVSLTFHALDDPTIQKVVSSFTFTSPKQAVQSTDTSDWKTYTDPATGLSFQYPADVEVLVENYAKAKNAPITIVELGKTNERKIVFYYYENNKNLSLAQLDKQLTVTDDVRGTWNPDLSSTINEDVTVGKNIPAFFTKNVVDCEPLSCNRYIISKNKKVFVVLVTALANEKDPLGEKIMSTVSFK